MKSITSNILFLLLFLSVNCSLFANASKSNNRGIKEYEKGNYDGALTNFRDAQLSDPKSPIIGHNIGSSLYQQKNYEKSTEILLKSLGNTTDSTVLSQIYYNLGNALFRQDSLLASIEMYKKALEYNPADQDAKYNLELARALLKDNSEQQKDNQENQNQQNQNQQKQDQQENQDDQQDKQDQQNQNEQNQDKEEQEEKQQKPQNPDEMTEEEAKQMLKALENSEKEKSKEKENKIPLGGSKTAKPW